MVINPQCFQNSANKSTETRIINVDENGLNGVDRGWIKAGLAKRYKDTHIYYRGSYELCFLETKTKQHGECWCQSVRNCGGIPYFYDGERRNYIPDFIRNDVLFEVKSTYTWDNFGKDSERRKMNIAKLDAASNAGYDVFLVLDFIEYSWKTERLRFAE